MSASDLTLVIPGRNVEKTLEQCLGSVAPLLSDGSLAEIIFVDDGSTDTSGEIAGRFPVRRLTGDGMGPGAARNLGWRAAKTSIIWFIDSDCVAERDALDLLKRHLADEEVAGVGGSYGNMRPDSLLATLIHEEIIERHLSMPREVDFLATFNVVYRRAALEQAGGFDERLQRAQDAELSYRLRGVGARLLFEPRSRVKHFHSDRLGAYLRAQLQQGYWRVWLYMRHPMAVGGDSYSGWADHVQPPLAALCMVCLPFSFFAVPRYLALLSAVLLALTQIPMTYKLFRRTRSMRILLFAPMSFLRSFWRAAGMMAAVVSATLSRTGKKASP